MRVNNFIGGFRDRVFFRNKGSLEIERYSELIQALHKKVLEKYNHRWAPDSSAGEWLHLLPLLGIAEIPAHRSPQSQTQTEPPAEPTNEQPTVALVVSSPRVVVNLRLTTEAGSEPNPEILAEFDLDGLELSEEAEVLDEKSEVDEELETEANTDDLDVEPTATDLQKLEQQLKSGTWALGSLSTHPAQAAVTTKSDATPKTTDTTNGQSRPPTTPQKMSRSLLIRGGIPRTCPRCRGSMIIERDWYGAYGTCLSCGYTHETITPPPVEDEFEVDRQRRRQPSHGKMRL